MYRAGVEGILGIRRAGETLVVAPCLPAAWPGFSAIVTIGASRIDLRVEKPAGACTRTITEATFDGVAMALGGDGAAHVDLASGHHVVVVRLG